MTNSWSYWNATLTETCFFAIQSFWTARRPTSNSQQLEMDIKQYVEAHGFILNFLKKLFTGFCDCHGCEREYKKISNYHFTKPGLERNDTKKLKTIAAAGCCVK
jgi:hypothetical protein